MNYQTYLRVHIQAMEPYTPILPFDVLSQQLGFPVDQIVKLDANENPYGAIPAVAEALAAIPYAHIYPDPESRQLREAIEVYTGVSREQILVGAGADELIDLIMRLFLDPGDCILNCPPTFGMYKFDAEVNAARVISVPRNPDFSLDLEGIEHATAVERPKVLFLASPNNPDGRTLPQDVIQKLLNLPIILVLDEAYMDFADTESMIDRVKDHENLVVLRTFSKWPGLAGLRVGYGVFPEWMMPHLWKIKQPYNVSVAAATGATVSLAHVEQLEARTAWLISERERLFEALAEIPWLIPYPTQANFILCRVVGRDAGEVKRDLATRYGILIRYFNKPGLNDHVRISVGKPAHTDALIAALRML